MYIVQNTQLKRVILSEFARIILIWQFASFAQMLISRKCNFCADNANFRDLVLRNLCYFLRLLTLRALKIIEQRQLIQRQYSSREKIYRSLHVCLL